MPGIKTGVIIMQRDSKYEYANTERSENLIEDHGNGKLISWDKLKIISWEKSNKTGSGRIWYFTFYMDNGEVQQCLGDCYR